MTLSRLGRAGEGGGRKGTWGRRRTFSTGRARSPPSCRSCRHIGCRSSASDHFIAPSTPGRSFDGHEDRSGVESKKD
ncbi:unnamed protein product [Triticum turgidum subsp. durum]|uniref:Uncharacterized protein n=1 Tax=Triticum turgidum subsp. durum TaxID=4567 RepID=A0A9R1A8K2_TRITD|nr:unnamed protein product [Triticum turgidum subsp. durum]